MAKRDALQQTQDDLVDAILGCWLTMCGRESLILTTFESVFLALKEQASFFKRLRAQYGVDAANTDRVAYWFMDDNSVVYLWNRLRQRYKLNEYPLGVLNLPERLEDIGSKLVERTIALMPGWVQIIQEQIKKEETKLHPA